MSNVNSDGPDPSTYFVVMMAMVTQTILESSTCEIIIKRHLESKCRVATKQFRVLFRILP